MFTIFRKKSPEAEPNYDDYLPSPNPNNYINEDYSVPTSSENPPLIQALSYLLQNPSIPLMMRRQFFMLWENVIFGNFDKRDRLFLMSKFREWCILLKWYIPEQKWGNVLVYEDTGEPESRLEMDLNLLINTLTHLYYINLTRGKEGFTVKEMTTIRSIMKRAETEEKKKGGLRLF